MVNGRIMEDVARIMKLVLVTVNEGSRTPIVFSKLTSHNLFSKVALLVLYLVIQIDRLQVYKCCSLNQSVVS